MDRLNPFPVDEVSDPLIPIVDDHYQAYQLLCVTSLITLYWNRSDPGLGETLGETK